MAYFEWAQDMVIDDGPIDADHRRLIDQDEDTLVKVTDTMTDEGGNRDPRRCLQLPPDVIAAGLTANPR